MDEAPAIDAPVATLSAAEPRRPRAEAGDTAWFSIATDVALGGEPVGEWLVVSPAGLAVAEREVARGEPLAAGGAATAACAAFASWKR